MDIALNRYDLCGIDSIEFKIEKIETFDELLKSNLDNVFYLGKNLDEHSMRTYIGTCNVKRKKKFFCDSVYFNLQDSVLEPTVIGRDTFHTCGYMFYKTRYVKQ